MRQSEAEAQVRAGVYPPADTYTVGRGKRKFASARTAVLAAKEAARNMPTGAVMPVWRNGQIVVAVVTDDANAITVHYLAAWRDDAPVF
jgi:hypothetical protein